jgi:hypothetical protein
LSTNPQLISYAVAGVIILLVLALRFRNVGKERPLKVGRLAIAPLYLAAVSAFLIWKFPVAGLDWAWMAIVFGLGAGIGWFRGKTMHISVHPETKSLMVRSSPWALIVIIALLVVRMGLREMFAAHAADWHVSFNLLTDAFVAFALGLLGVTSLEMYLRARRVMEEAKAGRSVAA